MSVVVSVAEFAAVTVPSAFLAASAFLVASSVVDAGVCRGFEPGSIPGSTLGIFGALPVAAAEPGTNPVAGCWFKMCSNCERQ